MNQKLLLILKNITHVNAPFEALNERSHFKKYLYECLNHGPTENWTATGNPYYFSLSMRSESLSDDKTFNVNVQTNNVSNKTNY